MSATDYTTLIALIRGQNDDPSTGNLVYQETPQGTRDGTNGLFRLQNRNIITGTVGSTAVGPWFTYGTSYRQTTGFTLTDAPNGYVTITSVPDNNVTFPFFFDYSFLWFTDSEYNSFIDAATEELGIAKGTATAEGLFPALVQYALDKYWTRHAAIHARKFASSAGGASESIQTVTQAFLALAKVARAKGIALRDDYYTAFGAKKKPSSWTITQGISPYSPRR